MLSPRQRALLRDGRPLTLIPRYFDLLVFLVERRGDAVHRRDIFDIVWADVIVSDSALSQAIRTLRRTLGDDSREPTFIRTVSRHGYQFVYADVVEEDDDGRGIGVATIPAVAESVGEVAPVAVPVPVGDPFAPLIEVVTAVPSDEVSLEDQRDAAERLHLLGTAESLGRLGNHPRSWYARALLRDTRHLVTGAGAVPIVGQPHPVATAARLVLMRLRRAAPLVVGRSIGGGVGGALVGAFAGLAGGLLLSVIPHSEAPLTVAPVLALLGVVCGLAGGAGVAAGIGLAEALAMSWRLPALVLAGAAGGFLVGGATQLLAGWTLGVMFGLAVPISGAVQGLALGAGTALGYAIATRDVASGLAAPRGRRRMILTATTMAAGALAALGLALAGWPLAGGTIHAIAQETAGSRLALTPIGQLIGEPGFGPVTGAIVAMAEGGLFGCGLALGITRRF